MKRKRYVRAPENVDSWDRVRFHADLNDYRPVKWPPLGPYWCSGWSDTYSVVVAYVPHGVSDRNIREFWPEAKHIDRMQEGEQIEFSDRFPQPDWWKP